MGFTHKGICFEILFSFWIHKIVFNNSHLINVKYPYSTDCTNTHENILDTPYDH